MGLAALLVFPLASLLILFAVGWGVTALLAPPGSPRALLTPFVGIAVTVVWDYIALALGLDLTRATWALLIAALALDILVLVRLRASRARAPSPSPVTQDTPRWTLWGVVACAVFAYATAVAPLLRYGIVTIIGENWDYEFYLPLADWLRAVPTAALADAPPNPLLTTILSRHILPLPMGFSYLQATLDVVTNQTALDSFAILLALLHALGVVAAFLFARRALALGPRAALAVAALVALNGLLLWFTYWNFGLHLAALALLPVTLWLALDALRGRSLRTVLLAGLFLGALNVTYHPALVAALLPLGLFGLYLLVTHPDRAALVGRGAPLVALAVAFSWPALFHLDDFLREYYGRTPLAIGLREYVPLSDGYGFSLNLLVLAVGHTIPTPQVYDLAARAWHVLALPLTLIAPALSLYALWRVRRAPDRRAVWYAVVGASVFYIALFRLPFLRPYPYGFLKSLSLVAYVLIAVAVQGAVLLWRDSARRAAPARALRLALGVTAAAAFALTALTFLLSVEQYFKPAPPFFGADDLSVRAAASHIPLGAGVLLSDRPEVQEIPMGLAAYALGGHPLYGRVTTGYGALDNAPGGAVYDYALLARGENPLTRGYTAPALWQNERFALYPRAPGMLLHDTVNRALTEAAVALMIDARGVLSDKRALSRESVTRTVQLGLLAFEPQKVFVTLANRADVELDLGAGLSLYTIESVELPAPLRIVKASPVNTPWVMFVQQRELGSVAGGLQATGSFAVECFSSSSSGATCRIANPTARSLTYKWIVRGAPTGQRAEVVASAGEVTGVARTRVEFRMNDRGALTAIVLDDAAHPFPAPDPPAGTWRAAVELWDGPTVLARFDNLAQLKIADGRAEWRAGDPPPPVLLAP